LKRTSIVVLRVFLLTLACIPLNGVAACDNDKKADRWVGTWASAPQLAGQAEQLSAPALVGSTLRQIVHVSIGGTKIRVRFSNTFGNTALVISSAHVAKAAGGSAIQAGTDKPLTFDERPSVAIPPGALMYSDTVDFDLSPLSDLAVTIFLKDAPDGLTVHSGSRATSYFTSGEALSPTAWTLAQAVDHWYFLNGVDVATRDSSAAVVVLGDSITDGRNSTTNGNRRWPDELARRLQANEHTASVGVLNEGIGGNRLLRDGLGPNTLARLDRDVLAQAGVRWLIVLEGVNDIGTCQNPCDLGSVANDIISAYQQIILQAHSKNIRVYGATITPFGGSPYANLQTEQARQTVNHWIRTSGRFDAVIDFDAALKDSNNPSNLSSGSDSGDHLHPGDAGYKVMADSINLKLFWKTNLNRPRSP
jgi:lysophospholipase L1-like esterase